MFMKKLFAAFGLLALVGAGCTSSAPSPTPATTEQPPAAPEQAAVPKTINSLAASDQKPGSVILISRVGLEQPGYIVIHADNNLEPDAIIANSALLAIGTTNNVVINFKTTKDTYYWIMLHSDNGDGNFSPSDDQPINGDDDSPIMMRFWASDTAALDAKSVLNLNTNGAVDVNAGVNVDANAKTSAVSIENFAFSERTLSVKRGEKITFTNRDAVPHTTTADDGAWDSGTISPNETVTMDTSKLTPGTYAYHCKTHPTMTATLIVQ